MKTLYRFLSLLILVTALAAAPAGTSTVLPVTGSPASGPAPDVVEIPSLEQFTRQVTNGAATQVTGLYVDDEFAFPVVQQPESQPAFVSSEADTITEFRAARSFGSMGFLAHNTLAGAEFDDVVVGDLIVVVYGDGHYAMYQVKQARRLQAVEPTNPYSSFVDLATGKALTAETLFYETYGVQGQLILQTCIAANGVDSWGRLFLIAEPYTPSGGIQPLQ